MSDPVVGLVVSTGRCGTQWLAARLEAELGDTAVVTHEPIGPAYRPREFFRQYSRLDEMRNVDAIARHLDDIEEISRTKTYIETGWPVYAAIPLFVERFAERLRLIHLVRHPVHMSMSYVTLGFFDGRDDEWARDAFLDPSCPGVLQRLYADRWETLSPFEKCLFCWDEINRYALSLRVSFPLTPLLRIRFEDLISSKDALDRVIDHFDLEPGTGDEHDDAPVDAFRFQAPDRIDWRRIFDHPRTVELAERLGYDVAAVDEEKLVERYRGPLPSWRKR